MLLRGRRIQRGSENWQKTKTRLREKFPESSMIGRYALLMDAQIKHRRKECIRSTYQRENANDVAATVVQVFPGREDYALDMVQRGNDVALKDAQITFKREEFA